MADLRAREEVGKGERFWREIYRFPTELINVPNFYSYVPNMCTANKFGFLGFQHLWQTT